MNSNIKEAKSFIIKELNDFIKFFSNTRVRYEFDIDANVHCVEVVPNEVYHLNNDYISWENMLTDKFIALFPNQNICFFSDDSIVGINNIQYEFIGINYVVIISTSNFASQNHFEEIKFLNSTKTLSIDKISSSTNIFNNSIAHKINQSNLTIDSFNSLTTIENQNEALFSINYPNAA
jgi:hypothetical protein